jgi:hypothetical protein
MFVGLVAVVHPIGIVVVEMAGSRVLSERVHIRESAATRIPDALVLALAQRLECAGSVPVLSSMSLDAITSRVGELAPTPKHRCACADSMIKSYVVLLAAKRI